MSLDPNKTYLVWKGTQFPNSTSARFKAPAGSTIDWGDGESTEFSTETAATHTYNDGKTEHTIAISGLTSIGYSAFNGCSSLTSITIPDSVTTIGNRAFQNCSGLTSIIIPDSVTSIDASAFENCSSLTSITIPDGVTSISDGVFYGCRSLTSVTIGNNVTNIGIYAFQFCSSLTSVTIGNSVTGIGASAFSHCSSLKQLVLFPSTPPTLGSETIPTTIQSIYVQQSSKDAYQKETNWTAFASKIVGDNIYLSFVRFNQKNKEYIEKKINDNWNEFNLENGTAEVLVQTTDSNHSFKVMADGRAKVQTAPKDNDDVVRKLELDRKFDKAGGTVTGDMVVGGNFTVQGRTTTVDSETLRVTDKLIEVGKGNAAPLTSPAGLITPKYDGTNNGGIVYDHTGTAYVGDIVLDENGNIDVAKSNLQPISTRENAVDWEDKHVAVWDKGNQRLADGDAALSADALGHTVAVRKTDGRLAFQDGKDDGDGATISQLKGYVPIDGVYEDEQGTENSYIRNNGDSIVLEVSGNSIKLGKDYLMYNGVDITPGDYVKKLAASLRSQAYVRNANGEDSGLAYTYTDEGNSLALRNASGQLQVSNPSQDKDAVNKSYADNLNARYVSTSILGG